MSRRRYSHGPGLSARSAAEQNGSIRFRIRQLDRIGLAAGQSRSPIAQPDTLARPLMKSKALWQISITTSREAEEAVAALLERLFGQTAAVYTDEDSQVSVVTVYVPGTAGQAS